MFVKDYHEISRIIEDSTVQYTVESSMNIYAKFSHLEEL